MRFNTLCVDANVRAMHETSAAHSRGGECARASTLAARLRGANVTRATRCRSDCARSLPSRVTSFATWWRQKFAHALTVRRSTVQCFIQAAASKSAPFGAALAHQQQPRVLRRRSHSSRTHVDDKQRVARAFATSVRAKLARVARVPTRVGHARQRNKLHVFCCVHVVAAWCGNTCAT